MDDLKEFLDILLFLPVIFFLGVFYSFIFDREFRESLLEDLGLRSIGPITLKSILLLPWTLVKGVWWMLGAIWRAAKWDIIIFILVNLWGMFSMYRANNPSSESLFEDDVDRRLKKILEDSTL